MKKFLYLLALCAMTMVSCESLFADDEPQKKPNDNTTEIPEDPENPGDEPVEEPKIEFKLVSEETVEFSAKGGTCVIKYAITNPDETLAVKVSCDAEWIVESDALHAPLNEIYLFVEANHSVKPRSTIVKLSYGEFMETVAIIQVADEEYLPYLSGIYHGNSNISDYNYSIMLSTAESTLDIVTGKENIVEGNKYLFLDLYSSVPSAEYNVKFSVPEGVYTFDKDYKAMAGTVDVESSYFYDATEGKQIYFVSGTVEVSKTTIVVQLVDADGKSYRFYTLVNSVDNKALFKGCATLCELSTLAEDLEIPFEAASLYAEGCKDYYVVGKDMWLLYIDDYTSGHSLVMELLTPIGEAPVGVFPVSSDLSKERMALPGFVDGDGYNWWSWYYCYDGYDVVGEAPIVSGSLEIVDDGAGTHTAIFSFEEDKGLTISGSCTAYFETYGDVSVLSAKRRVIRPSRK